MTDFFRDIALFAIQDDMIGFTLAEFAISITLSFGLSIFIAYIYKLTHSGLSYSRTFTITLIIMSVTVSFIMLIIGSNLARAFSLVGALSIIRFRNAVKDTRDTGFIFVCMAIGMACGTRMYLMSILFTVFMSFVLVVLNRYYFSSNATEERLFQFTFPTNKDLKDQVESILKSDFEEHTLLSSEIMDNKNIYVFSVKIDKNKINLLNFVKFRSISKNLDVKMLTGFEKFSF